MTDDPLSKPRFQIPSLKELRKQAQQLKRSQANERSRTEWNFALAAEHRRRTRQRDTTNDWHPQQQSIGKDQNEHRAEAYAFYCSILRDPNATVHEQLAARERIDILLGLDQG
ncbi:hypothetical protein [uncultured Gimesia sp.]|uniref:hypothetical protein n=1 Tax=uncultured Gimesia sp. TaxID=1678688 RepID=UPI0030DC0B84